MLIKKDSDKSSRASIGQDYSKFLHMKHVASNPIMEESKEDHNTSKFATSKQMYSSMYSGEMSGLRSQFSYYSQYEEHAGLDDKEIGNSDKDGDGSGIY